MPGARLEWNGHLLELTSGRDGLRTTVTVLCDAEPVAQGSGLGRVLLPLPGLTESGTPRVLVLAVVPGVMARAVLLVPAPPGPDDEAETDAPTDKAQAALDLARAERYPFAPAPGTFAARLRAFEDRHPRLWASRHVVRAVVRVLGALLGIAAILQLLVRPIIEWLAGLLPRIDWPDIDLPSLPLPDIDLPDVTMPGWLLAILVTAKFWVPILIAVALGVREVRRKRAAADARRAATAAPHSPADAREPDAHR